MRILGGIQWSWKRGRIRRIANTIRRIANAITYWAEAHPQDRKQDPKDRTNPERKCQKVPGGSTCSIIKKTVIIKDYFCDDETGSLRFVFSMEGYVSLS